MNSLKEQEVQASMLLFGAQINHGGEDGIEQRGVGPCMHACMWTEALDHSINRNYHSRSLRAKMQPQSTRLC